MLLPSAGLFMMYVRRDFMQRVSVVLHGTLGYSLLYALQEGCAVAVGGLLAPRAEDCVAGCFVISCWVVFTGFSCNQCSQVGVLSTNMHKKKYVILQN
jgi:hypothetical protein